MATQDDLKRMAGEKAVEFVPENEYIGIGTGSTVNYFIKALAASGKQIKGAVSSSSHLRAAGTIRNPRSYPVRRHPPGGVYRRCRRNQPQPAND